ncbi:TRAP transporter large permease subunit [Alteribacillus iranensis]|uniref:TRAP C4-dicarboxylate transport system permease DctM subunit domain-containing protein n=1 Tax=Alteribacillus iranensis TaxID=930128 RepID=A0A1I1ZYX3_9BACI|nr:TRAP transporter large permease subunit [Alteribacillus iranensis]SFE35660.1 hypothetical protein SAMN05192532_101469 [Alteribacillus iranensis]
MKDTYLGITSFVAVLLYMVNVFVSAHFLAILYSSLAVVLLLFAWRRMKSGNKIVVTLLLLVGSVLFLFYRPPLREILFSFGENLNLIALFVLIPLFGTFMSEAGYLQDLQRTLLQRERGKKSHPYRLGFLLTASMGWLLNLGSMPLVYKIGAESFSSFENKKLGMTILRGFGFCMLWSPYFVNVGLILILYDLTWSQVGGYGIAISLIYILVVLCFFPVTRFKEEEVITNQVAADSMSDSTSSSLHKFVLYIVLLLLFSFVFEAILPVNMLTVVSILAVVYPLVWSLCIRQFRSYIQEASEYVRTSFPRIYNEIGIFITAGFFGEALSRSKAGDWLSHMIWTMSQGMIPLFILFLIGSVILLALLGIHPVIIILGIGSSLTPEAFGVSSAFMGVLLLCAWTLATQVTPFSGSVLMASHLMNEKPFQVMKYNAPFILVLLIIFTGVLTVMNTFM